VLFLLQSGRTVL